MADFVDKGGLRFSINMADEFSSVTKLFRDEIAASRAAFDDFRGAASNPSGIAAATAGMKEFAAQVQTAAKVQDQATVATEGQTEAAVRLTSAEAALISQVQRKVTALAAERLAVEQGIDIDRLKSAALSDEEKAYAKVAAAAEKARVNALAQQIADKQGVELSGKKTAAWDAETAAAQEMLAVEQKLQLLEKTSSSERLQQLQTELAVKARIAAADKERAVQDALSAAGRDTRGNIVPGVSLVSPPPEQTIAELAQEKFTKDLKNAQISAEVDTLKASSAEWKKLAGAEEEADSALTGMLSTLGNLAIAFVGFTVFSRVIETLKNVVSESLEFNRTLENTSLALAGIFVAAGQVSDATGATVKNALAFSLAQQQAAKQTELLRQNALNTRASFEDLLKVFQVAVAPGLQAGFNVDQIRQLTAQMSEAASALGIEQNQLASEIRQILTATVTPRTNRLAASLGITNDDIKRAQAAGQLADFLQGKFAAFNIAGRQAFSTYDGLFEKIKEVFQEILGLGSVEFFNEIKATLKDVLGLLTTKTPDGLLAPRPEAIAITKDLFSTLTALTAAAREFAQAIDVTPVLAGVHGAFQVWVGDVSNLKVIAKGLGDAFSAAALPFTEMLKSWSLLGAIVAGPPQKAVESLSATIAKIPPIIAQSFAGLENTAQITKQIEADNKKSAQDFDIALQTIGLTNEALQQRKVAGLAQAQIDRDSVQISQDLQQQERNLQGIRARGQSVNDRIAAQAEDYRAKVNDIIDAERAVLKAEQALQAARDTKDPINIQRAADLLALKKVAADFAAKDSTPEQVKLATDLVTLGGREVATLQAINQLKQDQLDIQNRITEGLRLQAAAEALARTEALKTQNAGLSVQVPAQQSILAAKASQNPLALQTAEAQSQVDLGQQKLQQQDAQDARDVESLKTTLAQVVAAQDLAQAQFVTAAAQGQAASQAKSFNTTTVEMIALQNELEQKVQNVALAHDLEKTKIDEAQLALQRSIAIAEQPITFGIQQAFVQFSSTSLVAFNTTIELMHGLVSQLASFITDAITNAFDPNSKATTLQRFAQFLQGISKLVLSTMVNIALNQAALGLAGLFGNGAVSAATNAAGGLASSASSAIGAAASFFAEGGEVPGGPGIAPPAGVPSTDTVPAWLTPGEYVVKRSAVASYGAEVLEAINRGLVNPTSLRALAGTPSLSVRVRGPGGFAAGGLVNDQLFVSRRGNDTTAGAAAPQVVRAAIVPDEQSLERLMRGGKGAMMRWMQDNAGSVRASLGIGGGQ